ncbi:S-adenosyl-L-methionine-dependent methyltransferase [Teratosphaeria destructans]|uniref:S-adenosyl-L-methionine-dependent methyltransferase n=1 Tax=Teratosphaeria destructans TaxID=418781 RepID=A0A9W7SKC3_9PEZI|nr:S-adenosyl-L-methionine-dependent methyltransferase [Teratosphaeria destructans]
MSAPNASDPVIDTHEWTVGAQKYKDVIAKTTLSGTSTLVDRLHAIAPFTPSSTTIDIGCGTGSLTLSVHQKCPAAKILATDIAEGMLAEVDKLHLPNVSTKQVDGSTLEGIGNDTFTHGVASFTINFFPQPIHAVQSLHRVVKPHGVIGIAIWGERLDWTQAIGIAAQKLLPTYDFSVPESPAAWHSERDHRAALESVGLQDVQTELVRMPLAVGDLDGVVEYVFRGENPVMAQALKDFAAAGGDVEELEPVYAGVVREMFPEGVVYADAVLGWGRKP